MRPKGAQQFSGRGRTQTLLPSLAWEHRENTRVPISEKRSTIPALHLNLTATHTGELEDHESLCR